MKTYWIININVLLNTLELQDKATGNIIYFKSPKSVREYKLRQVFTFKKVA